VVSKLQVSTGDEAYEDHQGIEAHKPKIDRFVPLRPIERVVWIIGRHGMEDDLALLALKDQLQAQSTWGKVIVTEADIVGIDRVA